MEARLQERWRFMFENAGGIVGERAVCALRLARAEAWLEEASADDHARVEWHDDDFPYDHDCYTHAEIAEKFASNEWTGPFTCLLFIEGEIAASLGGIVVGSRGARDPYCRVVEAELASEALSEISAEATERERAANMDVATVAS